MAEILPFRAFRYTEKAGDLVQIMSPLKENSEVSMKTDFHANSLHHLILSDPVTLSGKVASWKLEKIIARDPIPSLYVYQQFFKDEITSMPSRRKGFICLLKIQDWQDNIVLKHEEIIPEIEKSHASFMKHSKLHINPIHGLYTDEQNVLDLFMEESIQNPILEIEDHLGIKNTLSAIQDKKCVRQFMEVMKNKQIVIADGHHRYASALSGTKNARNKNQLYITAYLTNTVKNSLPLLPFHRLIKTPFFNEEVFFSLLRRSFLVEEVDGLNKLMVEINHKKNAFGIVTKKSLYIIKLMSENANNKHPSFHYLRIVDELIIRELSDHRRTNISLKFIHNPSECAEEVNVGRADIAILVKDLTVNEVKNLTEKGIVLPEKSTYFYPKILSGIVMSSTDSLDGETGSPCYKDI